MQSCSRSSLGRWSMELLRGNIERGFFFFSRSGEQPVKNQSKANKQANKPPQPQLLGWLRHKPGFSLLLGAANVFLCISGVAIARIQEVTGENLTLAASQSCFPAALLPAAAVPLAAVASSCSSSSPDGPSAVALCPLVAASASSSTVAAAAPPAPDVFLFFFFCFELVFIFSFKSTIFFPERSETGKLEPGRQKLVPFLVFQMSNFSLRGVGLHLLAAW